MIFTKAPPILSRVIMAISALIMVGAVFIFVSRALEPVDIIPATPIKKAEIFNPKADVSKHPVFKDLKQEFMNPVPDMPMGRDNPFNSIVTPSTQNPAEGIAVPRSQLRIAPSGASSTVGEISTSTTESSTL